MYIILPFDHFFRLIYIFPTIYILFSFLLLFLICACLFITNHASGSFTVYDSMIMHACSQSPTYTKTKNVVASSHLSIISRVDGSRNQLCTTFLIPLICDRHACMEPESHLYKDKEGGISHLFVISRADCSQNQLCNTYSTHL